MKGKIIRKLTAEQYIKIPVITWRNYREETRPKSNPHLAPRLPWTSMNMLSKSWEIPHPHGLTMPSNTIKIPHIAPHRPGVGGVGVSVDKYISDGNAWPGLTVSSPGGLFISSPFEGEGAGLSETGGLFNLETTMVTVLQTKKTIIERGKAQVREVLGHAAEDQNQIRTSSW